MRGVNQTSRFETTEVSRLTRDCPAQERPIRPGLLLDSRIKRDYVGSYVSRCSCRNRRDRVHRCRSRAVRPARRRTPRRGGRLDAGERAAARPPRSAPSARSSSAEELVDGAGRGRRPHLHAEPSARPARRAGARRRQARDLREADRARRRRRPAARRRRRGRRAGSPPCRSSTATTRPCARRASACARA